MSSTAPPIGLIIVGDEILSGKRTDKHLPHLLELLTARGLMLSYVHIVADEPDRITALLRQVFASGDRVFCCGGIGATPDDHTRQCAAAALGVALEFHPEACALITERSQDTARAQNLPYDLQSPDHRQRLRMGQWPVGAQTIPNPYNKIPGFSCDGPGGSRVYFLPGFPVMAGPMMQWILERDADVWRDHVTQIEHSVIVLRGMEASLTPLMEDIEARYPEIKVFSLPSVSHPEYGLHIELGVKGPASAVPSAWEALLQGLHKFGANIGPMMVQKR